MNFQMQASALAVAVLFVCVVDASAYDRRVVVVNNTSTAIQEFYASNTGQDDWQEDILGEDTLPPGGEMTVNIDDGSGYCKYDFRAVFEDATEATKAGVNVCEVGRFSFEE
ncbi:hypothetical protein [Pleomorphomonas sp. NRK KF1]|uniref:hypothetical protein n=1 Tax=Pleomorphomonas sp. NRK KF1 TaxID=2943000 RepID=UPI0020440214|nr:hypothetical protein [Pleomorphomonas sp. NRK KF1]MCM5553674.1 hypothetical protein [Pleomorphomonas sp. NRK KF1]